MPISGFLMYGVAQKNKFIGYGALAILAVYLFCTSTANTIPFLFLNLGVIYFVSLALKRFNNQIVRSVSILIYSVIIDIICYFAFPVFTVNVSFSAYIWAGLLFNMKSALPVFAFASVMNTAVYLKRYYGYKESYLGIVQR
ncbi:MAG: hypothetical protein LBG88_00620 [Christensenellaceae bacterium]|jgi:hypothetical protein|nr:hypothetical protein [Christensenellaceae bacterium]